MQRVDEAMCEEAAHLLSGDWLGPAYNLLHGALVSMYAGVHPGAKAPIPHRVKSIKVWIGLLRTFGKVCGVVADHYETVVLPAQEALL